MLVSGRHARTASIQASSAKENEAAAKRHAAAAEQNAAAAREQAVAANEQTALMRKQLEESRLNFGTRRDNLATEVSSALEGNVGTWDVSIRLDVVMITVSEEPDDDIREHLEGVVRKYGYKDYQIDVLPDLTN